MYSSSLIQVSIFSSVVVFLCSSSFLLSFPFLRSGGKRWRQGPPRQGVAGKRNSQRKVLWDICSK